MNIRHVKGKTTITLAKQEERKFREVRDLALSISKNDETPSALQVAQGIDDLLVRLVGEVEKPY